MYNANNTNIIIVLFVIIFFLLFINHMFKQCKRGNNYSEGFRALNDNKGRKTKTQEYIKLRETMAYDKNQSDEESGTVEWENKSLNQCVSECNKDPKCMGFTRDNIGDAKKGKCIPKYDPSHCNSLRKGTKTEKMDAIAYNTYLKSEYTNENPHILNKCIGDAEHTLNNDVFISSAHNPELYLSYRDHIKMEKHNLEDAGFHKHCLFKIIPGLVGGGTVSFIFVDKFKDNYYLIDNYHRDNQHRRLELQTFDPTSYNTTFKLKSQASFHLENGMSDMTQMSISNTFNNYKYYWYSNEHSVSLVPEDYFDKTHKNHRTRKEKATFDLLKIVTDTFIDSYGLNNRRKLGLRAIQDENFTLKKKLFSKKEDFQSEFKVDAPQLLDNIIIEDYDGNRIRIPAYIKNVQFGDLKKIVLNHNSDLKIRLENQYQMDIEGTEGRVNSLKVAGSAVGNSDPNEATKQYMRQKFKYQTENKETSGGGGGGGGGEEGRITGFYINKIMIPNPKVFSVKVFNHDHFNTRRVKDGDERQINLYKNQNKINDIDNMIKPETGYNLEELKLVIKSRNQSNPKLNISLNGNKKTLWNNMIFALARHHSILTEQKLEAIKNMESEESEESDEFTENMNATTDKINNLSYFITKTIQILPSNPRLKFNQITDQGRGMETTSNELQSKTQSRLDKLKKDFSFEVDSGVQFNKYLANKRDELNLYKEMVNNSTNQLMESKNILVNNINKLGQQSNVEQLNKLSNDYFMINNMPINA